MNQSKELVVAIRALKKAEVLIVKNFENISWLRAKPDRSYVTNVDVEAEKIIRKILKKEFPTYGIIGEELGSDKSSEYMWTIDPIDGTHNYMRNMPFYGSQIALLKNKKPILAAINIPFLKKMYYAEIGKGAYCNGKKIQVSTRKIQDSILSVYSHELKNLMRDKHFAKIKEMAYRIREIGAGSVEFGLTSEGCLDVVISENAKIWDMAPGKILIDEAGGVTLNHKGIVVSGNKEICKKIIKQLKDMGV